MYLHTSVSVCLHDRPAQAGSGGGAITKKVRCQRASVNAFLGLPCPALPALPYPPLAKCLAPASEMPVLSVCRFDPRPSVSPPNQAIEGKEEKEMTDRAPGARRLPPTIHPCTTVASYPSPYPKREECPVPFVPVKALTVLALSRRQPRSRRQMVKLNSPLTRLPPSHLCLPGTPLHGCVVVGVAHQPGFLWRSSQACQALDACAAADPRHQDSTTSAEIQNLLHVVHLCFRIPKRYTNAQCDIKQPRILILES